MVVIVMDTATLEYELESLSLTLSERLVFCQAEIMINMSSTPTPETKEQAFKFINNIQVNTLIIFCGSSSKSLLEHCWLRLFMDLYQNVSLIPCEESQLCTPLSLVHSTVYCLPRVSS